MAAMLAVMDEDINALTSRIIGLAMRVHTRLGPGLLEKAYQRCLRHELTLASSFSGGVAWRTGWDATSAPARSGLATHR
jgi:hypothetical protein